MFGWIQTTLSIGLLWALPGVALAQIPIKVATSPLVKPYHPMLEAIYKEIGLRPVFVELPPERALRNLESGEIDADIGRAAGSAQGYANMVETQEMLIPLALLVVKRRDNPTDLTPANLASSRLGLVHGAKIAEMFAAHNSLRPQVGSSMPGMLHMLVAQRIDYLLISSGTPLATYPEFAQTLVTQDKPLHSTKAIHIFAAKWADYAPRFDQAVRTLRASGRLAQIVPPPS